MAYLNKKTIKLDNIGDQIFTVESILSDIYDLYLLWNIINTWNEKTISTPTPQKQTPIIQNQATGAEVQIGKNRLKGLSQPGMPLCPTVRKPIVHQLRV